jgi:predicted amidohydrolase YtcJ
VPSSSAARPHGAALAATVIVLMTGVAAACANGPRPAADLIVIHARIWTGDRRQPEASAVAIVADRIADIGSTDRIVAWRGEDTRVIDAENRRVVPGFNDAHVRIVEAGTALEQVDLRDARDAVEIARRIGERARMNPGEWIVGGRWSAGLSTTDLPTRAAIDDVTNGTPVFVVDGRGARALVNSAAFGRAGITEQTVDPAGGRIVRDARGLPTGVVEGAALALVDRAVPRPTLADRTRVVKRALERAASLGVTSLQDIGASGEDVAAFADLANRAELTARIYAVPPEAGWYDQAKLGLRRGFGSSWLRLGAVVGATSAISDDPHATDLLRTRLMAADHAGLQICLLAADAKGVLEALDRVDDLVRADGARDRRVRIEHAERASASDAKRFASLQAVASLQPDAGPKPDGAAVFDAFVRQGVRVALGSGWPEETLDPMRTLRAIGAGLPIADALAAYTNGSAFAEFQDGDKGTLARGQLADLAILSGDILAGDGMRTGDVTVLTTIAGGRVVHQRRP